MMKILQNGFSRFSHNIIKILRKINILQRLIIAFLILVILPTIFITLFTYNKYVIEIESNMEKFISLLVQNVNVQMTDKLTALERVAVQFYSDSTTVSKLQHTESDDNRVIIGRKLNTIAQNNGNVANMLVITPQSQFNMMDEFGNRNGAYIRDIDRFRKSEYYTEALKQHGYPVWFDTSKESDMFYRSESIKYGMSDVITMTQAIYNIETREFIGVLVLNVNISVLTDSLKSYAFYGSGNTFLFGRNGAIKGIHSNISEPNFSDFRYMNQHIYRVPEGSYSGKVEGTNIFMVYKLVPYTDLSIVHILNKDRLLENAYKIRNLCLTIVAVLIMLSIVVVYWTTISISLPLNKLMRAMKTFTKDNFVVHYSVSGNDEITVLGEKFNEMVDNTNVLIDQIYVAEIKQKTLELNKTNAELNVLQMQINPHFLYNTLDIIRWESMYETGGESKASRMIEDFCRLMRMTIKKSEDMIPIEMELEHAQTYIEVINFRHREKIALMIDCKFNMNNYYIPKLTIQPLIENAIVHGFDDEVSQPTIHMDIYIEESDIMIRIMDNGVGMEKEKLIELTKVLAGVSPLKESIALNNVNQRLKLHFGERYGLHISSESKLGTTILVRLPMKQDTQSSITHEAN
ncbi:cache domain-containing sensor histidine kinase [Paenibacillus sp. CMAA1364]